MDVRLAASFAILSAASWGCAARNQPAAAVAPANVCPAHGEGFDIAVQETARGARVVYRSQQPGGLAILHGEVLQRIQPPRARAAGGSPAGSAVPLPPVSVGITRAANQLVVTYEALELADVPRVKSLVRWDAREQQTGRCPSLQVQPDPVSDPTMPEIEPRYWTGTVTGVKVEPSILQACNITRSGGFMAFEPMDRRMEVYPLLRQVVRCLQDGALAGRRIRVMSYADPVTDLSALEELGGSRAHALARFLSAHGVDLERIEVAFGKRDQAGTDERGWAWYRRVDLELVNP